MSLTDNLTAKIVKRIIIINLILIGIIFLIFPNPKIYVYGLVFGSIINILNFRLMSITLAKSTGMPQHKVLPYVVANYMIRYTIYAVVLTISVKAEYISFYTVLIGFFMVKVVIISDTFIDIIKGSKGANNK